MWYPQQELNLCLRLRRRPFFPLNYAGIAISMSHRESGDPWGIRTPDGLLDREVLYPTELTGPKKILQMEPLARLKLATSTFGGLRSIRLSYRDTMYLQLQKRIPKPWVLEFALSGGRSEV